jgi:hypothetical protein
LRLLSLRKVVEPRDSRTAIGVVDFFLPKAPFSTIMALIVRNGVDQTWLSRWKIHDRKESRLQLFDFIESAYLRGNSPSIKSSTYKTARKPISFQKAEKPCKTAGKRFRAEGKIAASTDSASSATGLWT